MPKKPTTSQRELDISWRTRELGPEMRRELFRRAVPSVKLASEHDDWREHGPRERLRNGHARGAAGERSDDATAEPGARPRPHRSS